MKYWLILLVQTSFLFTNKIKAQPTKDTRKLESTVLIQKLFIDATKHFILGRYDQASDLYTEILRKDKDNSAAYYELSRCQAYGNNYNEANTSAKRAFELDPKNIYYAQNYIATMEKTGQNKELIALCENLNKTNLIEKKDDVFFAWASSLVKTGKIEQAIKIYDQLEQKKGRLTYDVSIRKYQSWLELNKTEKAVLELEKLAKAYPNNQRYQDIYEGALNKTGANKGGGNTEKTSVTNSNSSDLSNIFSNISNTNVNVEEKIRQIQPYLGRLNSSSDKALQEQLKNIAEKMVGMYPENPKVTALAGDIYHYSGYPNQAIKYFNQSLEVNPEKIEVWQNMLYSMAQLNLKDKLLKRSEDMIDLHPNNPIGHFYNGQALVLQNKPTKALEVLKQALALSGNNPNIKAETLGLIAICYSQTGKVVEADDTFEQALKLAPKNPNLLQEYALSVVQNISSSNDRLLKAEEYAKEALRLTPNNPNILYTYARLQYRKKNYKEAQGYFDKSMEHGANLNPQVLEHYGDLLYKLDQTEQAVQYWRKAHEQGLQSELLDKKINTQKLYE